MFQHVLSIWEHRAQIFKRVRVKFYYIFFELYKVLKNNFVKKILGQFVVNLSWQFFEILISFNMAAFIDFEAVTSSNF